MNGTPAVEIWNAVRPKYPVKPVKDTLDKIDPKKRVTMEIKQLLDEIKSRSKHTKSKIIVGELSDETVAFLEGKGVAVHTQEIYLTHKGLSHLARESKRKRGAGLSNEDVLKIPEILKKGSVYFDKKGRMNVVYCKSAGECGRYIKIVVDTKGYDKKFGNISIIKTAGYIVEANLKNYTWIE